MTRVAIFGGGVGGLTAAHELRDRGYEVDIYELKDVWGGKARSMSKWDTGVGDRKDLPGEHGFRFFPGFYRHVPDTMGRIDTNGDGKTVLDGLVSSTEVEFLQTERDRVVLPARFPRSLKEWGKAIFDATHAQGLGFAPGEARHFLWLCAKILMSCNQRRFQQLEFIPWWQYTQAEQHSGQYKKLLAIGLTRSLVAMRAETASTRTVGIVFLQVALDMIRPGDTSDRVLNGPTSEVWIDPWVDQLTAHGVRFHSKHQLLDLSVSDGRISGAVVIGPDGETKEIVADYYISSLPAEVMARFVTRDDLAAVAPSMANVDKLTVQWMNGIQFYVRKPYPIVNGHTIFSDSAWALTSISQAQFWAEPITDFGDGTVEDVLSVDISNWDAKGEYTTDLPASHCTREEIATETWAQLEKHLQRAGYPITWDDIEGWFLDPDILMPVEDTADVDRAKLATQRGVKNIGALLAAHKQANLEVHGVDESKPEDHNLEPLLINTIGSWYDRPGASVEIPNLFLAADYVQTHTDLATMEGANEAARRAVNALLDEDGSKAEKAKVWKLKEPWIFAPFKWIDSLICKIFPPKHPAVDVQPPGGPAAG